MQGYIEAGVKGSPVLLLLHGVGGDARSFKHQLENLSVQFHVVAWHLPGYGGTGLPEPLSFSLIAEKLFSVVQSLQPAPIHMLGHSIGGMLAQEFVAKYPGLLESLMLSATSPAFGSSDGDFQQSFLKKRLHPLDNGKSMADLADGLVDSLVGVDPETNGVALARECMAEVPAATYRAMMEVLVTFDRRQSLPSIDVKTLLIAGEHDSNAPASMMEKTQSYIKHSDYVCIAGAGHLAYMERPNQFNEIIEKFIHDNQGKIE